MTKTTNISQKSNMDVLHEHGDTGLMRKLRSALQSAGLSISFEILLFAVANGTSALINR
jgi:hypothetical protein